MKKIKVLIVDDHTLVRDGIRALLALVADIEVVGEAGNGKEALDKVKELMPDVVLMDLAMPIMGGLEATRRIRKEFPETRVVALTQYDDSEYVIPVIEAGACGYVTKMVASSELTTAIQAAPIDNLAPTSREGNAAGKSPRVKMVSGLAPRARAASTMPRSMPRAPVIALTSMGKKAAYPTMT